MSSFSVPLSGLTAAQDQLQSVSNNLANMNTNGYKDQNVSFSDIFFQTGMTNGAGDPLQAGGGTKVGSTTSNFTEGNLNPTSIPSNMAIQGNGFFVTRQSNGQTAFTRAGDFNTNKGGQLVTPNGEVALGYPAVNGVVSTSSALQPLQVTSSTIFPASSTKTFQLTANLNSADPVASPVVSSAGSTVTVIDSLGTSHVLNIAYTKTAANAWTYDVSMPTSELALVSPPTTTPATSVKSGSLAFSAAGVLSSTTPISITIPGLADLATMGPIKWNLADASGNPTISQTATASATTATTQDGYGAGTLSGFSIMADGTIQGAFTNGQSQALGQVAVASFANAQGLAHTGNNDYQPTAGSGEALIGVAGTGGRGTIVGGNVEQSNVDLAAEFAKMIVAQQAYQANAKAITTFDQLSQTTIGMKI